MNTEIERKWLLKRLPNLDNAINETHAYVIYLSTDPYIRIRKSTNVQTGVDNTKICIKGQGSLNRTEIEYRVDGKMFDDCRNTLGHEPIHKHCYWIDHSVYDGAVDFNFHIVEEGTPNEFIYTEVEFESAEKANAFKFPFEECGAVDVTHISTFKMNRVWDALRSDEEHRRKFLSDLESALKGDMQ